MPPWLPGCFFFFAFFFFASYTFFFFSFNEIYRWVKIGLWIWFITTKLFGWISLPLCPWSSQESFTWHTAINHSISASLPPSLPPSQPSTSAAIPIPIPTPPPPPPLWCFLWFCGTELISVNFWKALCYTVKWVSKEVIRDKVSGWWDVILFYSIFENYCVRQQIIKPSNFFRMSTTFHIFAASHKHQLSN